MSRIRRRDVYWWVWLVVVVTLTMIIWKHSSLGWAVLAEGVMLFVTALWVKNRTVR